MQCIDKPLSEIIIIGKEALPQAASMEMIGAPVVNRFCDIITLQLNIRTISSEHMSSEKRSQDLIYHVNAYADFGMQ